MKIIEPSLSTPRDLMSCDKMNFEFRKLRILLRPSSTTEILEKEDDAFNNGAIVHGNLIYF